MEKYIEQNGIIYDLRGEQYYPLLELPEQKEICKYGRLHLEFLKAHRKGHYTNLLSEGTLNQRLCEIDLEANEMLETFIASHVFGNENSIIQRCSHPKGCRGNHRLLLQNRKPLVRERRA